LRQGGLERGPRLFGLEFVDQRQEALRNGRRLDSLEHVLELAGHRPGRLVVELVRHRWSPHHNSALIARSG
jgi:hypothetical protein